MSLTEKDLNTVLNLAELSLPDDEKSVYLEQLSGILDYMDSLNQLDLKDVPPTAYANQQETPMRDDVVVTHKALILEGNPPLWENDGFKVPKILDSES